MWLLSEHHIEKPELIQENAYIDKAKIQCPVIVTYYIYYVNIFTHNAEFD